MAGTGGFVGREREFSRPRGVPGGDARLLVQRLFWWRAKISFSGRPGSRRRRTANRGLAAARSILFVLAAAAVLSVTVIGAAPAALAAGPSVSLVLTPGSATITAGLSQEYQATLYYTSGQGAGVIPMDVTGSATFNIAPDGTCTSDTQTCTATTAGPHTVTGTVTYQVGDTIGTATTTASLDVNPGPPVSLALDPGPGTITAGDNQPYHATGQDAHGNTFDATGSTTFTITDGKCTNTPDPKTCTAATAGLHTVTGTYTPPPGINASDTTGGPANPGGGAITGTATLDVQHGPPATLTLDPGQSTITAGTNQPYHTIGKDAHGNSFDVTGSTTFTITDGKCANTTDPKTCTATTAGRHIVTGTYHPGGGATATGTATLDVNPPPPVSLRLDPGQSTITAGGHQDYRATGQDANRHPTGDLTGPTSFTISPDGKCDGRTCTPAKTGRHTVTGTYHPDGGAPITGTATLDVNPPPPVSLRLDPGQSTSTAGGHQDYRATGQDANRHPTGDLTRPTTFTISPDGKCDGRTCTPAKTGRHTVTGTYHPDGGAPITGTATLDVDPPPPVSLRLDPGQSTSTAGGHQDYRATGQDANRHPTGDLTRSTSFTISPDGKCDGRTCTPAKTGRHTVTGTYHPDGGAPITGTATLDVNPPPPVSRSQERREGTETT